MTTNATGAAAAPTDETRAVSPAATAPTAPAETPEQISARAVEEHSRYIEEMLTIGAQGGFSNEDTMKAVRSKESIADFSKRALANLAAKQGQRPEITSAHAGDNARADTGTGYFEGDRFVVGVDREMQGRSDAMAEALAIRMLGSKNRPLISTPAQADYAARMGFVDEAVRSRRVLAGRDKPTNERSGTFLQNSFAELAATCLGYRGSIRSPAQAYEIMSRAFQTTSDFPLVLEAAFHKVMLARYQIQTPTYREISSERRFNDFRDHPLYRVGSFPMLEEIGESGEIRAGSAGESKESFRIKSYAKYFPVTRQLLVNDDMGAIDDIIGSIGLMVTQFENIEFYKYFNSNPTLKSDSTAIFHANHGNLSSSGHEPTPQAISLMRLAMRKQTDMDDFNLTISPSILLIPGEHETRADMLNAAISASNINSVNPFAGKLRPVVEGLITGHEWYGFADPSVAPCFVHGFLNGASGPKTTTDEPFTVQGIRVKVEHDFGVGVVDYRGAYKDTGAAPTDPSFPVEVVNAAEIGKV